MMDAETIAHGQGSASLDRAYDRDLFMNVSRYWNVLDARKGDTWEYTARYARSSSQFSVSLKFNVAVYELKVGFEESGALTCQGFLWTVALCRKWRLVPKAQNVLCNTVNTLDLF